MEASTSATSPSSTEGANGWWVPVQHGMWHLRLSEEAGPVVFTKSTHIHAQYYTRTRYIHHIRGSRPCALCRARPEVYSHTHIRAQHADQLLPSAR